MTLDQLIKQAREEVAKLSSRIRRKQRQIDKQKSKHRYAERQRRRAKHNHRPRRAAYWLARKRYHARRIRQLTKREANLIEWNRDRKAALARRLRKRAAAAPLGRKIAEAALKFVGVHEGSATQVEWAHNLGYSSLLPWCSIFAANMLLLAGWSKAKLPGNPAYSGAWIAAPGFRRVNRVEVALGDFLIFDWGDGGMTDHVAVYTGNNMKVGGNEADRVEHDAVPWGNVVAIMRPVG